MAAPGRKPADPKKRIIKILNENLPKTQTGQTLSWKVKDGNFNRLVLRDKLGDKSLLFDLRNIQHLSAAESVIKDRTTEINTFASVGSDVHLVVPKENFDRIRRIMQSRGI